jgi:uncharacterized membrane protein YcaP (DUF421 family)
METLLLMFGEDEDLTTLQMSLRALVVAAYCLLLLRISGRRAMAMGTPIDNVSAILLGAVLSRAVTGASPFIPTMAAAATLALLHRGISYLGLKNRKVGQLVKGSAKVVYRNGRFNEKNLRYCRISMHDLMAGVRTRSGLDNLEEIRAIYIERNGEISVIRKKAAHG